MKCNKKWVLLVAVALAICVLCVGLAGCDDQNKPDGGSKVIEDKLDKASDLVFLKINNCTADWIDDNNLSVKVPNTTKLSITDLILSPNAESSAYLDEEYSKNIADIKDIDMPTDEMEIYIKVTHNDLRQDYKVRITRSDYGERVDNRGGHKYIPEGVDKVTIEGVEYNVIREYSDLAKLNGKYIEENCILANNIYYDSRAKLEDLYLANKAIFDGNNFTFSWKQQSQYFTYNYGVIKNLILNASYNTDLVAKDMQALVHINYGEVNNCVNKNDYEFDTYISFSVFATRLTCREDCSNSKILNCINYGDVTGKGLAIGIGDAQSMVNCVNVGNITSQDKVGFTNSVAAGIAEVVGHIERCANLGKIDAFNACGIAFLEEDSEMDSHYVSKCINYGEIVGHAVGAGMSVPTFEYKKETSCHSQIDYRDNINYGRVSAKYYYDIITPIIAEEEIYY